MEDIDDDEADGCEQQTYAENKVGSISDIHVDEPLVHNEFDLIN